MINTAAPPVQQDGLLVQIQKMPHGDLHFCYDAASQATLIIAIDSTQRGPALGGCRYQNYPSLHAAITDVCMLAQGMTYKAALAGLPLGGGKAVIIKDKAQHDRKAVFRAFGKFVNQLGGRYITAVDAGTNVDDIQVAQQYSPYCTGLPHVHGFQRGDPSYYTTLGVVLGMECAVHHRLGKDSLKDVHVAIQGLGHVGYFLAQMLSERGAQITACDTNEALLQRAVQDFSVTPCAVDAIYDVAADIFSPCALGGTLNQHSVSRLRCDIIAGSANNQLASPEIGQLLADKQILYAPDYVINSGGLIFAAQQYLQTNEEAVKQHLAHVNKTLNNLFSHALAQKEPTSLLADRMAQEILKDNKNP